MYIGFRNIALLLVLCFSLATGDHHTHEHNTDQTSISSLNSYDQQYHDYHHHHPVEPANCGQVCPRTVSKYGEFEVGQVYTVDLDGQTQLLVKDGQQVGLKAKVDVQVLGPCEFTLKLRESAITGDLPDTAGLSQELDSSPAVRFGAYDGKILGICPQPDEQPWTLNIKKSVLSAMQVTTKDLSQIQTVEEVDISGHCTTIYRPVSPDTADQKNVVLERTKNLNKCHLRRKNLSGFGSRAMALFTEFLRENLPILRAHQKCTQEIKAGHLFSVQCVEQHELALDDQSLVKSTLNLQFAGKAPAANPAAAPALDPKSAQSLLLTRDNDDQQAATEATTLELLKKLCLQVNSDKLAAEVTESYHSLVQALKTLPDEATRTLDAATKASAMCPSPKLRQLFIDASAFAASDGSLQTLIDAFKSDELSEGHMTLLFSVLALRTRPSETTIEKFVTIIEKPHSSRRLVFGVSLLVRSYCRKNDNCEESAAVKKVVDILLKKLADSDQDIERIALLKALDNIKAQKSAPVKSALLGWAEKSDADAGVRVAAIQALQRIADDNVRDKLIAVLKSGDSTPNEVRTQAYRAVVLSGGATAGQLDQIKSETDPLISNYIRTHVKNLKESTNTARRALIPDSVQFDEPKTTGLGVTRNIQRSYRGLTIETDIVHPKGSLVPSLYTFAIAYPMGDKDYQVMEVQLRQQGLDSHIRKIFSKGFGAAELTVQLTDQLMELLSFLRDPNHKHSVTLQASVRLGGKNVAFLDTFEDIHNLVRLVKDKIRETVKSGSMDKARGLLPLDSQVEVPSINGFPLLVHLRMVWVAAAKGVFQLDETPDKKSVKMTNAYGYVEELSSGIRLKVRNYRPGFDWRMRTQISRWDDLLAERSDDRVLKLKINLPAEKRTWLLITQRTLILDGLGAVKSVNDVSDSLANEENTRCKEIFGLKWCKSKQFVDNSPIPNAAYTVERLDPALESIEATLERPAKTATDDHRQWSAKLTAGPREYSAQFDLEKPASGQRKASLKLQSPKRTVTAEAKLNRENNDDKSKLELDVKVPGCLDIDSEYNIEKTGDESKVDVTVEYQLAGADRKESVKWQRKSKLEYKKDKKSKQINVDFDGQLQLTQFPELNQRIQYVTSFKPYQTSKTDMTYEWGKDLQNRAKVGHVSKMDVIELRPFQMVSENTLTVEYTPLDIDYEVKLNSDIATIKSKPRLLNVKLVGKDQKNRPGQAVQGELRYENMEQPVQQVLNASLSYPGNEISYYSEVKQIKDLTYSGKMIYSPTKNKVITIDHKESITNPTQNFFIKSEAKISYSDSPSTKSVELDVGYERPDLFRYRRVLKANDKKMNHLDVKYDTVGHKLDVDAACEYHDKAVTVKVDDVVNPKSAQLSVRSGPKSYKFSAARVPKESIIVKLDSAENSRLKEFKAKVSRKEKSSLRLVVNDGQGDAELNTYIDLLGPKEKRAHLDFKCPRLAIDHQGDIVVNRVDRKLNWDSKTNKNGKLYYEGSAELVAKGRSFLLLKKHKTDGTVSKFEYFHDKSVYGAVLDTSRFSAVWEGENKGDGKRFGKLGFVDKLANVEHKSHINISNGILTIKSLSDDKDKQSVTKLDAQIGLRIVSEINLVTPNINGHLKANPLAEPKTLVVKWVGPVVDYNLNVDWARGKYLKLDSQSERKVDPKRTLKVDAYLTRQDESKLHIQAPPQLDFDVKRVLQPKPHFVFNTTISGYNEIQEFDSNPSLSSTQNLVIALGKWFQSYTSTN